MTTHRSILAAAALLALTILPAGAITLPVAEDTSSSALNHRLTLVTGAATTLSATPTDVALVRFDLGKLPANITADNISSATLRLYVISARAGTTTVAAFPVTSDWHEKVVGNIPSADQPGGVLLTSAPVSKTFISADVTAAIKSALTSGPNFGFLIDTAAGRIVLGAKEGAGVGFPAELDIESTAEVGPMGIATFFDVVSTGSVSAGTSVTAAGPISGASLATDGANGSFFLNTGFPPGVGTTTLMSQFTGKNGLGPQLRFTSDTASSFTDIGQDGNSNFVIETDDTVRLTITPAGNLGLGTSTPAAALDVRGDVKLGSTGQFFAPGSVDKVSIVRGLVLFDGTRFNGTGFTVARTAGAPTGDYTITFTTPFTDQPALTVSPVTSAGTIVTCTTVVLSINSFRIQTYVGGALSNQTFSLIAIGGR